MGGGDPPAVMSFTDNYTENPDYLSRYYSPGDAELSKPGLDMEGFDYNPGVDTHSSYDDVKKAGGNDVGLGLNANDTGLFSPTMRAGRTIKYHSQIFQVMEIRCDSQDSSMVEKVILPEENLFSLCNILSCNSAKTSDGRRVIDFSCLDSVSRRAVGFYGSKDVMLNTFLSFGIENEKDICSQMRRDNLSPGLYVWSRKDTVFVFYWHKGKFLPDASLRDMSCNFVRYLVDLCDTVHVCLEAHLLKDVSFNSASKFCKRQRTQRLQIDVVQETENSVTVSSGFSMKLNADGAGCNSAVEGGTATPTQYKWTEGRSRVAFLASFPSPPKVSEVAHSHKFSIEEFKSRIRSWESQYFLDLTNLSQEDFLVFLEFGREDKYREYMQVVDRHSNLRCNWSKRKQASEELEEKEVRNLSGLLTKYIQALMQIEFPTYNQIPHSNSSFDELSKVQIGRPHVITVENDDPLNQVESNSTSDIPVDNEKTELRLMERKISEALFHPESKTGIVFPGTKYRVSVPKSCKSNLGSGIVTLNHQWDESEIYRPFQYGEGVTIIPEGAHQVLRGRMTRSEKGVTIIPEGAHQVLRGRMTRSEKGLVLQVKSLSIEVGSRVEEVTAQLVKAPDNGLESWMKAEIRMTMDNLMRAGVDAESNRLQAYRNCLQAVEGKIWATIRKLCTYCLAEKVKTLLAKEYERLEVASKKEKADYLRKLKHDLSQRDDRQNLPVVSMISCSSSTRYFYTCAAIGMKYTIEEKVDAATTWRAFELSPMKGDLEKLVNDPEYVLCPMYTDGKYLVDIDPRTQRLLRVFTMEGGQVLVCVEDRKADSLLIYLSQKLGTGVGKPIRSMKRGYDLLCFDEQTRFIAFYDKSIVTIKVFRFDDSFRHMDWTGAVVTLSEFSVQHLIWMGFVSGKPEIIFIDEKHRVRVAEVNQPAMVRPGNLHLGPNPLLKAIVSSEGSCLMMVRSGPKTCNTDIAPEDVENSDGCTRKEDKAREQSLSIEILKVQESIVSIAMVAVDIEFEKLRDPSSLDVAINGFGSQLHLLFHSSEKPWQIASAVVRIVSATDVCHLRHVTRQDAAEYVEISQKATKHYGPIVDYIPQVFEKYATSPSLFPREVRQLHVVLLLGGYSESEPSLSSFTTLKERCVKYVEASMETLEKDKGKSFKTLKVDTLVRSVQSIDDLKIVANELSKANKDHKQTPMGLWVRRLVCLVPMQIARAENNSLQPMVDGLQLPANADFIDAISLANVIRFGLYESVINNWVGHIKVISSMGKQSSGKSYLLNHLSGSLLDVAGGRCTDGVWMTVRQSESCLYVLLDFEGLGSFERSEQEDMLLSILNAAISNLTIFNKKDFHLDKETEAIFERFQTGVSLVKADSKLFRGLFYMAIKDVDTSDVEDLKREFCSKISKICSRTQDNFLTKMYGGAVEISAMPFFNRPEFHESIEDIAETVAKDIEASYFNGKSFLRDFKLIISQISTRDWSSIDSKRVALRLNLLKENLRNATTLGSINVDGLQPLVQFDSMNPILDEPLEFEGCTFHLVDTQLELLPLKESHSTEDITLPLLHHFTGMYPRTGVDDEGWHLTFEKFMSALVQRRKKRVLEWLTLNTIDFPNDGDVRKVQLEAITLLSEIQQNLLLCSCKCERCFLRCVRSKGHLANHSCRGDHKCAESCTYCKEEGVARFETSLCGYPAGHDGPHDCNLRSHMCGKGCILATVSSNCNRGCSLKTGHDGDHRCNSKQHNCSEVCSLPSCRNECVRRVDGVDDEKHTTHACHETFCPERCSMEGCNRTCSEKDHFHSLKSDEHFCGFSHSCEEKCEHEGNCSVNTEVNRKINTFKGKRGSFDYELVSEQSGERKTCCLSIPPFEKMHAGPHLHSEDPNAVHFCKTRCHSCGYFCSREFGHGGLHRTTHGNMRGVTFASESEEIDILDRKYTWGESGVAELCNMHCKARGRGHIHLINCPANSSGGVCWKMFDGARHETCKYGPDFNVPKDEIKHSSYWEYMRFEDPCSTDDRKEFDLCDHQCRSEEHKPADGGGSSASYASYCTEALWHDPIFKGDLKFGSGYITDDGHHFSCNHSRVVSSNVIFIIDRSSSMGAGDCKPSMTRFTRNRLGCVHEAITRFIRTRLASTQEDVVSVVLFHHSARTSIELEIMKEDVVNRIVQEHPDGSTTYSSGLLEAERILRKSSRDASINTRCPTVIFLSDGGNNGGSDPLNHVRQMKALDPRLQVHTIMFGNDPAHKLLQDMANLGDGTFEVSLDEVQLSRRFEGLAKSLKTKVAALM